MSSGGGSPRGLPRACGAAPPPPPRARARVHASRRVFRRFPRQAVVLALCMHGSLHACMHAHVVHACNELEWVYMWPRSQRAITLRRHGSTNSSPQIEIGHMSKYITYTRHGCPFANSLIHDTARSQRAWRKELANRDEVRSGPWAAALAMRWPRHRQSACREAPRPAHGFAGGQSGVGG